MHYHHRPNSFIAPSPINDSPFALKYDEFSATEVVIARLRAMIAPLSSALYRLTQTKKFLPKSKCYINVESKELLYATIARTDIDTFE